MRYSFIKLAILQKFCEFSHNTLSARLTLHRVYRLQKDRNPSKKMS